MYDSFKVRETPLFDDTWKFINRRQTNGLFVVHWSFARKERVVNGKIEQSRCFLFYQKGKPSFFVQIWPHKK